MTPRTRRILTDFHHYDEDQFLKLLDVLREQSLLVREERLLASIPELLAAFRDCLENLKREVPKHESRSR